MHTLLLNLTEKGALNKLLFLFRIAKTEIHKMKKYMPKRLIQVRYCIKL